MLNICNFDLSSVKKKMAPLPKVLRLVPTFLQDNSAYERLVWLIIAENTFEISNLGYLSVLQCL